MGGVRGGSVPSFVLKGILAKDSHGACPTSPRWGCFHPVVLPPEASCPVNTRVHQRIPRRNVATTPATAANAVSEASPMDKWAPATLEAAQSGTAWDSIKSDVDSDIFLSKEMAGTAKNVPKASSRGREQVSRLLTALENMLKDTRSRGGRKKLAETEAALDGAEPVCYGAQLGLSVISALELVVHEEGEVKRC